MGNLRASLESTDERFSFSFRLPRGRMAGRGNSAPVAMVGRVIPLVRHSLGEGGNAPNKEERNEKKMNRLVKKLTRMAMFSFAFAMVYLCRGDGFPDGLVDINPSGGACAVDISKSTPAFTGYARYYVYFSNASASWLSQVKVTIDDYSGSPYTGAYLGSSLSTSRSLCTSYRISGSARNVRLYVYGSCVSANTTGTTRSVKCYIVEEDVKSGASSAYHTATYEFLIQQRAESTIENDSFSSPIIISDASGSRAGSNAGATLETSETKPSVQSSSTGSVWYKWTAPSSGTVTFDTIGSGFDTVLGVYTGSSVSSLTEIDSNDDIESGNTKSRVTFTANSGTTYRIAVYGYNGANGSFTLNWSLTSGSGGGSSGGNAKYALCVGLNNYDMTSWRNQGWGLDVLNGCVNDATYFRDNLISRGGWSSANVTKLTDSGATKTAIRNAIQNYAATAVSGDTFIYMHSSHGLSHKNTGGNYTKDVALAAYAGPYEDYELASDLAGFASGVKVVVIVDTCHSGGLFKSLQEIQPFDLAERVSALVDQLREEKIAKGGKDTVSKNISSQEIGWVTAAEYDESSWDGGRYDSSAWLTDWSKRYAGNVRGGAFMGAFTWGWWNGLADTTGIGDSDGSMDAYEGYKYAHSIVTSLALPEPQTPQCLNASVLRSVELGTSGGSSEPSVPSNDNFSNAARIYGTAGSTTGSNVGATYETGEPLKNFKAAATNTVWWVWTAPSSGSATFCTTNTTFDTVMGVYTGTSVSSLTTIKQDDDGGPNNTSICTFDAVSGTTYYIAVSGYGASKQGTIKLDWNVVPLQTYTVTYKPGSYASGSTYTAIKTNNVALVLRNATYSRTGYTQAAWSTSSTGTSRNYELGANYTANAALTLYPYWTTNTYTISYSLNGGAHGTTHPSSATYDTAFYVSAPTKSGYTFAGWTVTSGLNTSTAKWGTTSSLSTSLTSSSTKCVNGATGNVYFKNLRSATGSVTLTANWTCNHSSTIIQNARAATCTEAGYTGDTVCSTCGATIATGSTIPALGHQEGAGVVTKEPTATEEGVMTYSCTSCGIVMRTEAIPKVVTTYPDLGFATFSNWDFGYSIFTTTNSEGGGVFSSAPVRLFDRGELFSIVFGYGNYGEAAISNATLNTIIEMVSEAGEVAFEDSAEDAWTVEPYRGSKIAHAYMAWTNLAAGVYTARVTLDAENAIGDTNRANNVREFVYAIRDSLSLGEALGCGKLVFNTSGDDWYGTHDGVDQTVAYARTKHLGNYGTNVLSTTVSGAGALSFDWKVSSEQNYDWLEFLIDGVVTNRISGTNCVWQSCSYELSDGNHAVEWRYRKDESYYAGLDCAWLANIEWNPTTVYTITFNSNGGTGTMTAQTFTNGVSQALHANAFTRIGYTFAGWSTNANGNVVYSNGQSVTMSEDTTLYAKWTGNTYTVTLNRQGGSGGTASATATYGNSMPSITKPTRSGYMFGGYYTSTNGDGTQYYTAAGVSARSWNIAGATTLYAKWIPTVPLATALDNAALTFVTGGAANWVGVADESYFGGSSARSGAITHSQSTWMQAQVSDEGTLSFWYKVSSESNWDTLVFYVDGIQKITASGTGSDWLQFECVVSNNVQHVFEWSYTKDFSVSTGSDCCWVDKVEWMPKGTLPSVAVDADVAAVDAAVDGIGFADDGVKAAIGGSAAEYAAFKEWAGSVKGAGSAGASAAGEAAVVANTNAAAAYLLGAERLFENAPVVEIGDVVVGERTSGTGGSGETGEAGGTAGTGGSEGTGTSISVTVTVKDGEEAVKCAAEKVKAMFEATGDLGDWSGRRVGDNAPCQNALPVSVTVEEGEGAMMRFKVTPGDGTAPKAFLRIRK